MSATYVPALATFANPLSEFEQTAENAGKRLVIGVVIVWRATTPQVQRIIAEFPGFEYSTPKGTARQYNFVVEVEGGTERDPILDPNEHQAFAWVDEENFESFVMSGAMRLAVADALAAVKVKFLPSKPNNTVDLFQATE